MKTALKATILIFSIATAFFVGGLYQKQKFLKSARYVTTKPLKLYSNTGAPDGTLPEGVILYSFGGPDEYPHFILIIGTKALNTLKPDTENSEFNIIPTDASTE